MFLRASGQKGKYFTSTCIVHILDWVCKGQRRVARSTFAAELLSAGDAADRGLLLAQQLHEMLSGPRYAVAAGELRLISGFAVPLVLIIDAMSVFAAVTAAFIKIPAERSLMSSFYVSCLIALSCICSFRLTPVICVLMGSLKA